MPNKQLNLDLESSTNRDFKGVWLPKNIWLETKLSLAEKFLLTEIDSLDNENGCFATNNYFQKFLSSGGEKVISIRQIQRYIEHLKELGYITIEMKNSNKRIMRMVAMTPMSYPPCHACHTPHDADVMHNNTDNNTDKNSESSSEDVAAISLDDPKHSESWTQTKAKLEELKRKVNGDKRYAWPTQHGAFDWRYVFNYAKCSPGQYFIAIYWKTKEQLSDGYFSYSFKNKEQAVAAMMSEKKNAETLAAMMTIEEFKERLKSADESAYDEKKREYWMDWKLSTILKNLHHG